MSLDTTTVVFALSLSPHSAGIPDFRAAGINFTIALLYIVSTIIITITIVSAIIVSFTTSQYLNTPVTHALRCQNHNAKHMQLCIW